ncbi:NADPH-dependent FMN reductase [Ferruginibacter sp. HRS2-29]|uniref:NADPH-dependent FMN reductase n=1 Tax=Ferruginibacter sp. HRS2-29 TaxID=2487334 RepID=UPI0020CDA7F0|nr:NAD(P)H-dependent oxidoreductase [Ferruginibacter sp. HRS2-29]MCP9750796.1 NADPH-dependent oxidoreductase [Ferruginibacter sp. HRS2-29]
MITIISGTNRKASNTRKVSLEYQRLLLEKNIEARLLLLDEIDMTVRNQVFIETENELLKPARKFIIVMPEYNGSYPGILKLMMDNTDVSKVWWHKKVLLTGVATGRAGNLRGMEHLTGSLLHMKMLVHPNRLPISLVDKLLDADNHFADASALRAIDTQLEEFLEF